MTKIVGIEVECSTYCNWRCVYCPVSQDPKPPRSMDPGLFDHILRKAVAHPSIGVMSINAYCEPTIDKGFEDRVHAIANTRLRLQLYTNGSALSLAHIRLMRDTHILNSICFNLPSADPHRHARLTASPFYAKQIAAIDKCLEYRLPVTLSVQGTPEELKENLPGILERFPGVKLEPDHILANLTWCSSDRCGVLKDARYYRGVDLQVPLVPCPVPESWIYLNIDGDLFLCCEDYYQKTVYANIRDGSIEELISKPERKSLLPENCPPDGLCRRCVLMPKLLQRKGDNHA